MFERDGRTWVVFGAYDRKVHFVDYETGEDILPPFETGDIIKGSVSVDPDGLPLVYTGSRDNKLRVIAIDRPQPTELWALDADDVSPTKWNDDWDGSPLVLDDYLYEGGENSQFHIVKLNRSTGPDGLAQVAPELVFNAPGWDDELTAALNTRQNDVSIENSVAYHEGVVYFANSGGLVQGWDVSGLAEGVEPTRVFRFWTGDDTDASVVIDDEGFLYVGVENERGNARAAEVGQLVKLDPRRPDEPARLVAEGPRRVLDDARPPRGRRHRRGRRRHGVRRRPADRRHPVDARPARADVAVGRDRRRHADPGRLRGRAARLRRVRHDRAAARAVEGAARGAASSRPPPCGRAACSWAPAAAASTPSATPEAAGGEASAGRAERAAAMWLPGRPWGRHRRSRGSCSSS